MAFAGAVFLFKKLNENGYKDEMKRHNRAMEKFNIGRERNSKKDKFKKKLPDFDRS